MKKTVKQESKPNRRTGKALASSGGSDWLVELLQKQAQEIADEGHAGWGNTMNEAADKIMALETIIRTMKSQASPNNAISDTAGSK